MPLFSPAEMLTIHGLTLMICGALAYNASGMQSSGMSAIYVGNGGAVISFLLAAGVRDVTLRKGDAGYKLMMACVHIAVVYPVVLGAAVAWRLYKAWAVADKQYLRPYLGGIVAVCVVTTAVVAAAKPMKKKKEKEEEAEDKNKDTIKHLVGGRQRKGREVKRM